MIKPFRIQSAAATLCLAAGCLSLSGCASGMFSNEARCPFDDKGGCQSVSDVNRMVDERRFTDQGQFVQQAHAKTEARAATPNATRPAGNGWQGLTPYAGEPLRSQEKEASIWVAPWQDTHGAYHGPSFMTFVIEKPAWQAFPAKAIITNDYAEKE
jgi:type IV conjugative transfer system lipoprotein TraV